MVYSASSSHLVSQGPLTQPISITYAFLTPSSNPLHVLVAHESQSLITGTFIVIRLGGESVEW